MATEPGKHEIRLHRTGGSGPNAQWQWQVLAEGRVLKKGTALGEEHKAYATARKVSERLAKG